MGSRTMDDVGDVGEIQQITSTLMLDVAYGDFPLPLGVNGVFVTASVAGCPLETPIAKVVPGDMVVWDTRLEWGLSRRDLALLVDSKICLYVVGVPAQFGPNQILIDPQDMDEDEISQCVDHHHSQDLGKAFLLPLQGNRMASGPIGLQVHDHPRATQDAFPRVFVSYEVVDNQQQAADSLGPERGGPLSERSPSEYGGAGLPPQSQPQQGKLPSVVANQLHGDIASPSRAERVGGPQEALAGADAPAPPHARPMPHAVGQQPPPSASASGAGHAQQQYDIEAMRNDLEYQATWEVEQWKRENEKIWRERWQALERNKLRDLQQEFRKEAQSRLDDLSKQKQNVLDLDSKLRELLFDLKSREHKHQLERQALDHERANFERDSENVRQDTLSEISRLRKQFKFQHEMQQRQLKEAEQRSASLERKIDEKDLLLTQEASVVENLRAEVGSVKQQLEKSAVTDLRQQLAAVTAQRADALRRADEAEKRERQQTARLRQTLDKVVLLRADRARLRLAAQKARSQDTMLRKLNERDAQQSLDSHRGEIEQLRSQLLRLGSTSAFSSHPSAQFHSIDPRYRSASAAPLSSYKHGAESLDTFGPGMATGVAHHQTRTTPSSPVSGVLDEWRVSSGPSPVVLARAAEQAQFSALPVGFSLV